MTLAPDRAPAAEPAARAEDENYPMRRWVFEDSLGRFDIDLGDSHVQSGTLADFALPADLELGYGVDRGGARLARLVAARYGTGADTDRVVITHGAQEALYLLYCTLLTPGDRVLALRPGWQQAWDVPARLGCESVAVRLAPDFSLDLDALAAAADSPRLRLITLNSPSNPTGRRLRPYELEAVLALADARGAQVVLDEEYLVDLAESPAARDGRLVSVSSLSKIAGLPGLRVGWLYAPPELATRCAEYKHLTSISNSVLCERLAADALADWPRYAATYRRLVTRGQRMLEEFAARHAERIRLVPPEGTPFAWLDLLTGESSLSFARRVLDTGVLVMPGETLGAAGGIRVCFAREPDVLRDGLDRLATVLASAPRLEKETDET